MPLEAPVTDHLDKVADAAYRCSGQEAFSRWLVREGNS